MKKEKFNLNQLKIYIIVLMLVFSFIGCTKIEKKVTVNEKTNTEYKSKFLKIEKEYGVKLGIYVFDTETNKEIIYNDDEKFAYCSTFKALLAGAILQKYPTEQLKQVIKYTQKDILEYAPITKDHVDTGMTVEELCDAAVRFSDNTAGNLLLNIIGGPSGFKAALNQIGDSVTAPERIEPELNEYTPKDIKDISTPRQLAIDLKEYTTGEALTEDKQKILIDWMSGNKTGDELIRAGAPKDWVVADKSGSGSYGTRNDIAIVTPPNKKPMFVAILSNKKDKDAKYDNKPIAEASKIVFDYIKSN